MLLDVKPIELESGLRAAWHLFRQLNDPFGKFSVFWALLKDVCARKDYLYQKIIVSKRSGGKRILFAPIPELKYVQKIINKNILAEINKHSNCFGFSGGSIKDALMPIVSAKQPIFCADVKNAFPQTEFDSVFRVFKKQGYGFNSAYFLSQLTTWPYLRKKFKHATSVLPQGAPTSPRLFDLCFVKIDEGLTEFAQKVGGTYTRYADNIFFTAPTFWPKGKRYEKTEIGAPIWHSPIISAVFQIVWKKSHEKYFYLHKTYLCDQGKLLHALGLNLIDGQLHNRRTYKQRIRMLIYNLQKALAYKDPFEEKVWPLYLQLEGVMNFAIQETLPQKLVEAWERLDYEIYTIRYGGGFFQRNITEY